MLDFCEPLLRRAVERIILKFAAGGVVIHNSPFSAKYAVTLRRMSTVYAVYTHLFNGFQVEKFLFHGISFTFL